MRWAAASAILKVKYSTIDGLKPTGSFAVIFGVISSLRNMPGTMKVVRYYQPGPASVLKVEEVPIPQPAAGEVWFQVFFLLFFNTHNFANLITKKEIVSICRKLDRSV